MPSRILRLWNPDAAAWEEVGDSRLTAHLAAPDPHSQYLTSGEADTLFLTQSEGDDRYAPIGGGGGGGAMATDPLWDAKGDLAVGTGANAGARLAPGTDGQVLTLDSAQTLGLKWAAPAAGGLDKPTADTYYVNVEGDTMTGTLTAPTVAVPGTVLVAGAHVFGSGSPTYSPTASTLGGELGVRFSSSAAAPLAQLRWYRINAGEPTPSAVRLWDTTSTSAPVWTAPAGDLAPFADTAVGWKTATLTGAPTLVAGRAYVVGLGKASGSYARHTSYVPVPDSPLTFLTFVSNGTAGQYPSATNTLGFGIDPVLASGGAAASVAGTGALRLSNGGLVGAGAAVAWRNAADSGDLALTVDGSNALTFDGSPVQTQTTADTRYVNVTGDQMTGNLGVGVAPAAWGAALKAVQVADRTAVAGSANGATLAYNMYYDGAAFRALGADAGGKWELIGGQALFSNAPSVAAGAAQTFTSRLAVATTGTLTLTPDAGQIGLQIAGDGRVHASVGQLQLSSAATIVGPPTDATQYLGWTSTRWQAVYAVTGTIQTSLAEAKQDITPLAPEDALAAVRATDPVVFDYRPPERPPEWYELPDDPEQAAQVLEQRLTAAPLEEGARHQAGFVLRDETGTYATDPLFETGEGQSNAANSAGILLAAVKALDTRLTALEGA